MMTDLSLLEFRENTAEDPMFHQRFREGLLLEMEARRDLLLEARHTIGKLLGDDGGIGHDTARAVWTKLDRALAGIGRTVTPLTREPRR